MRAEVAPGRQVLCLLHDLSDLLALPLALLLPHGHPHAFASALLVDAPQLLAALTEVLLLLRVSVGDHCHLVLISSLC